MSHANGLIHFPALYPALSCQQSDCRRRGARWQPRRAILPLLVAVLLVHCGSRSWAGPFAGAAGQPSSDAISKDDSHFVEWASSISELSRGPQNISNPGGPTANFGAATNALGPAQGTAGDVVSLGDGGQITLRFAQPISDGPGSDFAVFENGFADTFLELAFVEVSSNGSDFFRFNSISMTPTTSQVGSFGALDPTNLFDLAGKYRAGFGTPFDLGELAGASPLLDVHDVRFVRIVDVVGSIDPRYGTFDSQGHLVNDPWPTPFASGGFDLDAVGVLHTVPEPAAGLSLAIALAACGCWRARLWVRRSRPNRMRVANVWQARSSRHES